MKNRIDYCIIIYINFLRCLKRGERVDFGENGMLPSGFHEYTFEQFLTQFVEGFPTSQRRKDIAKTLLTFAKEIFSYGIPYEFWVDGSYVTTKINPNDADVIVFLQAASAAKILTIRGHLRQKYLPNLDTYYAFAASPENQSCLKPDVFQKVVNDRNYWRGQFGFDRADNPKGIVKINCESILKYLEGGDIYG